MLGPVGGEHSVTEPIEDRLRNDQFLKDVGKLASEDFLTSVRLRAFAPVAGAVVVHVLSLFQPAYKQAAVSARLTKTGANAVIAG